MKKCYKNYKIEYLKDYNYDFKQYKIDILNIY